MGFWEVGFLKNSHKNPLLLLNKKWVFQVGFKSGICRKLWPRWDFENQLYENEVLVFYSHFQGLNFISNKECRPILNLSFIWDRFELWKRKFFVKKQKWRNICLDYNNGTLLRKHKRRWENPISMVKTCSINVIDWFDLYNL